MILFQKKKRISERRQHEKIRTGGSSLSATHERMFHKRSWWITMHGWDSSYLETMGARSWHKQHLAGDASCNSDPTRWKAIQRAWRSGGVWMEGNQKDGKTYNLMKKKILHANPEW